jgi:RNA polymerase sigma-70 factor (ECF subfamily)
MNEAALQLVRDLLATQGAALELFARGWCDTPEDVVQEALLRLMHERTLPERPIAWMYQAVRRRAITAARASARRRRYEAAAGSRSDWFQSSPDDRLDAQSAAAALGELEVADREVVIARLWGGLSFEEIGELVGCSSSAAHRRYTTTLVKLRVKLGESCPNATTSRRS